MDSFAFRLSCYEQFGWNAEEVRMLPELEAYRLSIYFEEYGAYLKKQRREQARANDSGTSDERVELYLGDDEEDE